MNTLVYIVSMAPGSAPEVALCLAHCSSAWITLGSRLQWRCGLDPWCFTCRYLWAASYGCSLWIRLLYSGSAAALKEALCKLFPGYLPFFHFSFFFFLLRCYFQDILPFVFHSLLEMRRICMASVLQMSMQLRMLFVDCIYQDRLQMEFVQ